jgi:hypothetical protein
MNFSSRLGAAFIAGISTGFICGILLRVIMRIIAITFPELAGNLTLGGILTLLITGISYCLAFSILFTLLESKLPINWFKKGLIFGIGILLIFGLPIMLRPDLSRSQEILVIVLFSSVFITGGLLLSFTYLKINCWTQNSSNEKLLFTLSSLLIIPSLFILGQNIYEIIIKLLHVVKF